jgi:hypothetical protein
MWVCGSQLVLNMANNRSNRSHFYLLLICPKIPCGLVFGKEEVDYRSLHPVSISKMYYYIYLLSSDNRSCSLM